MSLVWFHETGEISSQNSIYLVTTFSKHEHQTFKLTLGGLIGIVSEQVTLTTVSFVFLSSGERKSHEEIRTIGVIENKFLGIRREKRHSNYCSIYLNVLCLFHTKPQMQFA